MEEKTITEYKRYLRRDITPTLGAVPLTALSIEEVGPWVNRLEAEGNSRKTMLNKIGFLSAGMNAAVDRRLIPANPATGVRLKRTLTRRKKTFLTIPEYGLLKSHFTERWHPLLDLLLNSGLRFSEATALTTADIDREEFAVNVRQAWKTVPEGDGERYELGPPKTDTSIRTIHVPQAVIDALDLSHEFVFVNTRNHPRTGLNYANSMNYGKAFSSWGSVVSTGDGDRGRLGMLSPPVRRCGTHHHSRLGHTSHDSAPAEVARLLQHIVPHLLLIRFVAPAKLAAAACIAALIMAIGAAGTARADDDDPSSEQEICGALHMGLSPGDIAERLGRNDQRYNNYWQAWRTVGPTVIESDCG